MKWLLIVLYHFIALSWWYPVTLCTDGWWNTSSICKVHPCFLPQTFYLEFLFGRLPETLPSCSKYIFPIYLIWPFLKKEPAKCLLIWHKNCSHRLKQVLSLAKNLQEFYLRCFHTGLFYIVTINILKPSHHDRIKAPSLYQQPPEVPLVLICLCILTIGSYLDWRMTCYLRSCPY